METKLTLKLDKSVIQSVKHYAKKNKRSVSRLAEDYFRTLIDDTQPKKRYSPLVEELSGIVTEKNTSQADYISYLEKKYE